MDIYTSVYDKRDDFGFPIVNFPWLSGDVPRLPSYGIYISQLVRFVRCCTSVLDFHSKNFQITSNFLTEGIWFHKLRKTFGKFFRWYSKLLSKFGSISFQEYLSKGNLSPGVLRWSSLQTKEGQRHTEFISSGSKIVKRLRRRQYDPLIIEMTIGLVVGPSTALYRPFLKHCRVLSKPPQRQQGSDLCSLCLLVWTPSAIRPELISRRAEHILSYSDVAIYIFDIYNMYYLCCFCIGFYYLSAWCDCWFVVQIKRFINKFLNVCPFNYTAVAGIGKVEPLNRLTTPVGWL